MNDNERFDKHIFHPIEIVRYKSGDWSLECTKCYETILDQEAWEMLESNGKER